MIVVTFALPEESQDFRKCLRHAMSVPWGLRGRLSEAGEEIRVLHTGVGLESAASRMKELFSEARPRFVVSAGYAGGLDPRLKIADLVVATNFSSEEWAAHCKAANPGAHSVSFGCLTSQAGAVESVEDKAGLAQSAGAIAVDMETAAIAAACREAQTPLLSIRTISDSASEPLPVPFEHWFDLQRQRPRPLALVLFLLRHPFRILPFARFVRGLSPARLALTRFLVEFLTSNAANDKLAASTSAAS